MKRPLVPVALCYVGGLLLADWLPLSLSALFAWSIVLALACLCWDRLTPLVLGPLLALTGATNLTWRAAALAPDDLRHLVGDAARIAVLRGRLCETPYLRVNEGNAQDSWRSIAEIEIEAVRLDDTAWQPACGRVAVSTPGTLPPEFYAGRTVEITGVLGLPQGASAAGLFDYRTYLRRQGIYYQSRIAGSNDWQFVHDDTAVTLPMADRFTAWAKGILARGLPVEDEPLRLLWAMTLGWKTALTGEVSEPFMRSGTMHVFAISGLHIALIAGILVAVLRVFKVPRILCGAVVIPLIWAYTGVTGWQASAIRSTVMMSVVIAGWSLQRPSDLLNSLAAAAFLILLWDPQQLFQASFQLSFFVVLSLGLFAPVLRGMQERLLWGDPLLPDELRPRWQRWGFAAANYLAGGVTTSLAAWLGSIPLVAHYFHLFTPVSLLANLIVVPLSSTALACNLASLAVGGWFPACAELFNHSAWFWMVLMVRMSEWAARFPGGCFHVPSPHLLTFVLYYTALISLMAGWLLKPRLRIWTGTALALLGCGWLAACQAERSVTRLTILPLHGGEALYLKGRAARQDWLIDCGNSSSAKFTTKPFLRAQGVNHLSHLLLTHGDVRHAGGAEEIGRDFAVRQVLLNEARFRSPTYRRLSESFLSSPEKLKTFQRGEQLGPWTVLHPEARDLLPQADDIAAVLRSQMDGTRVLLLSDLGKAGQNLLMQRETDLQADIVVSGLPAQAEPLADALLDAIQPKVIIITDAERPATERASLRLQARLARHGVPVFYTRDAGAVTLELRRNRWRLTTMSGATLRSDER